MLEPDVGPTRKSDEMDSSPACEGIRCAKLGGVLAN
jgi:hypothetical protein